MRTLMATAVVPALLLGGVLSAQESGVPKQMNKIHSDRDRAGLRGLVRSVIEERTYPPAPASAGSAVDREFTIWMKTEYDRDGRVVARWDRSSSREQGMGSAMYVTRYIYTADGQLQRRTTEKDGERQSETVYHYDDRGRLQSIACSADPDNPIAFRYDSNGQKTKITIAPPTSEEESGAAVSYSPEYFFGTEAGAMKQPEGGSTLTLYDKLDRPTEVQVRNAGGEIVYRLLREYDAEGNVIAQRQTMDDVLRIIPAAQQKKIIDDAGVSAQELRDQLAKALGGGTEMSSTNYSYDAEGRETLRIEKMAGHFEQRVETTYNRQGDIAKETWHIVTNGMPDTEANENTSSERVFEYEYDSNGNWTVKKISSRQLPDRALHDTGEVVRHTIEYF